EGREHEFALSSIYGGRFDSYIRQFATAARDWGHPFFLRFNWEMNGNWFPWSEGVNGNGPGSFVAGWRHVHDIFESVGAHNVTWAWCPYADPRFRFYPLKPLYPGDAYVDWTCIDGYNWGTNPTNPVPWMSFEKIFTSTYRRIVRNIAPRKPMILAELASTGNGRSKSAWIRRMFQALRGPKFRRIRALVWFNQVDRHVDWPLENSGPASRAFRRGLSRGYRPNAYATLSESPIRPPEQASKRKRRAKRR
ncbi:MAG TPA: glycosyl hydrolase, partial [Solirubrobacterales bacterium]